MPESRDVARPSTDARVREVQQFARGALRASACLFYWTDESLEMREPELLDMSPGMFEAYRDGLDKCDPLNVPRLVHSGKRVSTLQVDRNLAPADDVVRFEGYMHRFGMRDVIDLMFWRGDVAFAGLGILKTESDPPVCHDTLALATTMHRYIEFTLASHPRVRDQMLRRELTRRYHLTPREIEVSDLVRCGCTNHDIAEALGIGLPTVKTHVMRAFDKLGIGNRASLAAKLAALADAGGGA